MHPQHDHALSHSLSTTPFSSRLEALRFTPTEQLKTSQCGNVAVVPHELGIWYKVASSCSTCCVQHGACLPAVHNRDGTDLLLHSQHMHRAAIPTNPTSSWHACQSHCRRTQKNNSTSISSLCNYLCTHCCVSYRDNSPLWMAPPFDSTQIWARTVKACRQPNHTTWRPDFGHPLHKAIC